MLLCLCMCPYSLNLHLIFMVPLGKPKSETTFFVTNVTNWEGGETHLSQKINHVSKSYSNHLEHLVGT